MTRFAFVVGFIALIAILSSGPLAQGNQPPDGSLTGLTAEVRQLRLAVEEATKAQTQTQALAVYLSVQKDRIFQVWSRLDSLRKDIAAAADVSVSASDRIARITKAASDTSQPPEIRAEIALQLAPTKEAAARAAQREQDLRNQEAVLAQSLQAEEARWSDLIARLEQTIKR